MRLAFLGEIGEQDRVVLAVDILSALVHEHRLDAELLVIGDGPQRAESKSALAGSVSSLG